MLMEASRRINESVRKTSKRSSTSRVNSVARLSPRKRLIVAVAEKDQGSRSSNQKSLLTGQTTNQNSNGKKDIPCLTILSLWHEESHSVIRAMDERFNHPAGFCGADALQEDKKEAKYCPYHRRKGHTLEQCASFRRIFDNKLQAWEIIFQNEGALNIHEQPFSNYNNDRGKVQLMVVSIWNKDTKEGVPVQPGRAWSWKNGSTCIDYSGSSISIIRWTLVQNRVNNNEGQYRAC